MSFLYQPEKIFNAMPFVNYRLRRKELMLFPYFTFFKKKKRITETDLSAIRETYNNSFEHSIPAADSSVGLLHRIHIIRKANAASGLN